VILKTCGANLLRVKSRLWSQYGHMPVRSNFIHHDGAGVDNQAAGVGVVDLSESAGVCVGVKDGGGEVGDGKPGDSVAGISGASQ
jgi:hypothetical protein